MTSLLSRLQSLTGPDREVDAEIALANGWKYIYTRKHWRAPDRGIHPQPPRYTESLDAIRPLMPADLYWIIARGKTRPDEPLYGVQILNPDGNASDVIAEAEHDLLEVALLIAIKRAKEETTSALSGKEE